MNIGWGELFAEKYNRPDAAKSFQAALKTEADNAFPRKSRDGAPG